MVAILGDRTAARAADGRRGSRRCRHVRQGCLLAATGAGCESRDAGAWRDASRRLSRGVRHRVGGAGPWPLPAPVARVGRSLHRVALWRHRDLAGRPARPYRDRSRVSRRPTVGAATAHAAPASRASAVAGTERIAGAFRIAETSVLAMTGGKATGEGIARLALSASDRTIRQRHIALALSLFAHGATLLALVYLLHRVVLPAPSPETSIAMVFAPMSAPVDATPTPAGPPIAEPLPVEQAAPLPAELEPKEEQAAPAIPQPVQQAAQLPAEPEPKAKQAAPAIPQPVEQEAPLPAESKPKVEQAAPAIAAPVPVQRPAPRQMAAARPSAQASRPAAASLSAPAAVAIAPLLPAHPVAGMESDRPPAYPEMARRRGQQGRVLLQVNVSAEGRPVTVAVVETSGYESLDAAALTAVQQWRFVPATRGGTPVPAVAEVPVRFRLTD